ncbi:unnamed protein product [Rotaria sordida]|uniref:Glycerol-3-phosphate dehydrogenase [NAD(+)] n=1 Tax=Rotaria sordida TaxID=392033 RepID=A0A813VFF5_9BILA|nr:unnamed protein product [Rotaria sordida]CAF0843542.1 unnamed protein product [Rotaria sordida]CAF0943844.1 unnamed protein product [Rotaria sordida]CAF3887941.1 unnamed protein product [Rotaria sordida]
MSSSTAPKKIAIVGSGNWGSAIAIHIGEKVRKLKGQYDEKILMWCREETLDDGSKLTQVINKQHENVKYLPHEKIPDNVIAEPDLCESVKDADVLIFVIPHQFVKKTCDQLKNKIKSTAFALTLIKGFYVDEQTNDLMLVSQLIKNTLNIPCVCLMGANIAHEVAEKIFCEATVGSRDEKHSEIVRQLIDTPEFRLRFYPDVEIIEMLGALKNVIAVCAGFADGLKAGFNTRAAVLRLGFREMVNFCRLLEKESTPELYLESCGIADLIASALGGRNYNGAKKLAETNKSLKEIEKEDLNGQSLQGPGTAKEVYRFLEAKNLLDKFPMFRDAYLICEQKLEPKKLLENLHNHPEFQQK